MSPGVLAAALALPAVVTLGIGIGFAALGGWGVLPFALVDAVALALAFLAWARRAPGGRLHRPRGADRRQRQLQTVGS